MSGRHLLPIVVVGAVVSGIGGVAMLANAPAIAAPEAVAPAPAVASNPKVAQIGNDVVLKSDIVQLYEAIKQRMGPQTPPMDQVFWTLVDQLVASRVIIAAATAEGLDKTPAVQSAIKSAGEQIVQEAYIRKSLEGIDSDASLKPLYARMADGMKGESEVHARHILVADEAKAKELIEQLNKGGDFAKLAAGNSKDPGSKDKGGDLGFFARGMMVPEFDAVAFALEPGKISQTPIKTQFGWHVLKVDERRARTAPKFEEAKGQLLQEAQQAKITATIEALKAKAKIERFPGAGLPPLPPAGGAPTAP